jgi:hypothetical protein
MNDLKRREHTLNLSGIKIPMQVKDIRKFEKQNQHLLNGNMERSRALKSWSVYSNESLPEKDRDQFINVYTCNDNGGEIQPLKNCGLHYGAINLLLFKGHYSLIKNMDRLLSKIGDSHRHKIFCTRCYAHFYEVAGETKSEQVAETKQKFYEHMKYCGDVQKVRVVMPKKGSVIKFTGKDKAKT